MTGYLIVTPLIGEIQKYFASHKGSENSVVNFKSRNQSETAIEYPDQNELFAGTSCIK
jgi:hypothetical protein